MRYRIWYGIAAVLILAAAVFGLSKRNTYQDLAHSEDPYADVLVAELPEKIALTNCERMRTALPAAPLIMRVQVLEDLEYVFNDSKLKVRVEDVFSGTDCAVGDEIYLTGRFHLSFDEDQTTLECFFVNVPKVGEDYLVFVEERVVSYHDPLPVYRMFPDSIFAPIFHYADSQCTILPTDGLNTYVPYEMVRENEFFVMTERAFQALTDLKHEMLERYPIR